MEKPNNIKYQRSKVGGDNIIPQELEELDNESDEADLPTAASDYDDVDAPKKVGLGRIGEDDIAEQDPYSPENVSAIFQTSEEVLRIMRRESKKPPVTVNMTEESRIATITNNPQMQSEMEDLINKKFPCAEGQTRSDKEIEKIKKEFPEYKGFDPAKNDHNQGR